MAATSRLNITLLDFINKTTDVGVHATALSAGNFTAQMGLADSFVAAVMAITLLNKKKDTRFAVETKFNVDPPTDDKAFRGNKWLVSGVDSNGNPVSFHIGGANTALLIPGNNSLDLTADEGLALKTAAEAYWKSNDGEAVTVTSVTYVDK